VRCGNGEVTSAKTFSWQALDVIEQSHETEIHMKLLMTVKERQAGIVGSEINFDLLIAADHEDILENTGSGLARDPGQLKAVPVQVDRVDVVAGIAHPYAVPLTLMQVKGGCRHHLILGIRHPIDGPLIESIQRGVLLFKEHV